MIVVSIPLKYNITIQDSTFDKINSCGAVISNTEDLNVLNYNG
jgi:hypothetical protein